MVFILIIMEIAMMEVGEMTKKMEKEFIIIVMAIEEWEIISIHVLLPSTRHFPLQKDYGLRTAESSL